MASSSRSSNSNSSNCSSSVVGNDGANNKYILINAISSAAAGIISRIVTHPLDTVKARLQAPTPPPLPPLSSLSSSSFRSPTAPALSHPHHSYYFYQGPVDAFRRTLHNEGVAGLYRGFGAVLVGGTPGTILYLCTYDWAKYRLTTLWLQQSSSNRNDGNRSSRSTSPFLVHFVSGLVAETIACVVYVPVDVVKERMQVQQVQQHTRPEIVHSYNYCSSWDALCTIARVEGLRGIYKGYGATLVSFGPFSALYFVFYEQLKIWASSQPQPPPPLSSSLPSVCSSNNNNPPNTTTTEPLPFHWTLFCSATAGALASWITSPLDMVKLRLQVSRGRQAAAAMVGASSSPSSSSIIDSTSTNKGGGASSSSYYRGWVHCMQDAYATTGLRGLFRGAGARVLHFTPATAITMTCYETCRSFILAVADDSND